VNSEERLKLIGDVYDWMAKASISWSAYASLQPCNAMREMPIAWDFAQISSAIAGNYQIEMNPRYKGVVRIRKNKELWIKVSQFVVLKSGQGCLPHDPEMLGMRWKELNKKGGK